MNALDKWLAARCPLCKCGTRTIYMKTHFACPWRECKAKWKLVTAKANLKHHHNPKEHIIYLGPF